MAVQLKMAKNIILADPKMRDYHVRSDTKTSKEIFLIEDNHYFLKFEMINSVEVLIGIETIARNDLVEVSLMDKEDYIFSNFGSPTSLKMKQTPEGIKKIAVYNCRNINGIIEFNTFSQVDNCEFLATNYTNIDSFEI